MRQFCRNPGTQTVSQIKRIQTVTVLLFTHFSPRLRRDRRWKCPKKTRNVPPHLLNVVPAVVTAAIWKIAYPVSISCRERRARSFPFDKAIRENAPANRGKGYENRTLLPVWSELAALSIFSSSTPPPHPHPPPLLVSRRRTSVPRSKGKEMEQRRHQPACKESQRER